MHVLGTPPALILSQDQTLKLKWSPRRSAANSNVDRLLIWLSNVVQFVKCMSGSQPLAPGELHPARKLRREALRPCALLRHPLILDGLCLHVLSSFQRTGLACSPCHLFRVWGNLPILLSRYGVVNPFPSLFCLSRRPSQPACLTISSPKHRQGMFQPVGMVVEEPRRLA